MGAHTYACQEISLSSINTKKDSTPEQLINAAQHLFAEKGFKATTVQDIAREAGVNISLVSYHFHGKEGLFRACIERAATTRLQVANELLAPPKSLEEFRIRLSMFIDEMLLYHVEHPDVCTILQRDLSSELPLIRDIFEQTFLKAFERLIAFFAAAQTSGLLADWVNPLMSATNFYGMIFHLGKHQDIGKTYFQVTIADAESRVKIRDYLLQSTLEGICKK